MPTAALMYWWKYHSLNQHYNSNAPVGVWVNDASVWVTGMPSLTSTCLFLSQADLTGMLGVSSAPHHNEDCITAATVWHSPLLHLSKPQSCLLSRTTPSTIQLPTHVAGPPYIMPDTGRTDAQLQLQICCCKWQHEVQPLIDGHRICKMRTCYLFRANNYKYTGGWFSVLSWVLVLHLISVPYFTKPCCHRRLGQPYVLKGAQRKSCK